MKYISYIDERGVQFSQDRTILENCPPDFKGSYVIPDSVTKIGCNAFSSCKDLSKITIPHSVTKIDYEAFLGCSSLAKLEIPNSVTIIEDEAFSFCCGLTAIDIPDSVTEIGACAFHYCKHTVVRFHHKDPNQIKVDESAFEDCDEHSRLCVPEGTKSLYSQHPVFRRFRSILEIPDEEWTAFFKEQ